MQIKNNVKIHNRFDIEIIDKNTGELKRSLVSYNIVLNQMYTRLCGGLSYFVNIHFGSGAGTLSPSRTTLFTHLGTKAAVDEEIIKAIPLSIWKRKIVINPEEYVGNTISEVGIAFGSTNTNLVTHSLLKDSEGNSISIVKTDVDVITIYATVFVIFDTSNPNLTYLSMPSSNQLVNYLIGGSAAPTGTFSICDNFDTTVKTVTTSVVNWVSDAVNKQRKTSITRFGTTVGNGHIKFLEFINIFSLELPYSPVFNGQFYENVSLGLGNNVKTEFILPSANIRESSILVKKNGLVTSDYTISKIVGFVNQGTKINKSYALYQPINYASISDNKEMLIIGNVSSGVQIFKKNNKDWNLFKTITELTNTSYAGLFRGNNKFIATSHDGSIARAYDIIDSVVIPRPIFPSFLGGYGAPAYDVDANDDMSIVAFACFNSPYVNVYTWNGTNWIKMATPPVVTGTTGKAIAMNNDGTFIALGTENAPRLATYDWNGTSWVARPAPSAMPSSTVEYISINDNASVMAVACISSPYIYVYDWNGTSWVARPQVVVSSNGSVALTGDGKGLYCSSGNILYSYYYDGSGWRLVNNVNLGCTTKRILLSKDETYLTMGGYDSNYGRVQIGNPMKSTMVKFSTPPNETDVITVDYIVDGVHKTENYVIDTSFAIQFGEI